MENLVKLSKVNTRTKKTVYVNSQSMRQPQKMFTYFDSIYQTTQTIAAKKRLRNFLNLEKNKTNFFHKIC